MMTKTAWIVRRQVLGGLVFFCSLLCLSMTARGAGTEPQWQGRWVQGGMLIGTVAPGSTVRFDERQLSVDAEGRFVLGLAYDAGPAAAVEVRAPTGESRRYEYGVAQREYDVQRIGGLPKAMVQPPPEVQARIADDQRKVAQARGFDTPRTDFAHFSRWPVPSQVTGVYGSARILNGVPRQPHFGVDMAAAKGVPIHAPAGGVVRLAEKDLYYTGGTVIIDHGQGISTTYLHLSRLDVAVGDEVIEGQVIGRVGATGRATGPHLCWRANWFDVRLDPSLLLQSQPARKGDKIP